MREVEICSEFEKDTEKMFVMSRSMNEDVLMIQENETEVEQSNFILSIAAFFRLAKTRISLRSNYERRNSPRSILFLVVHVGDSWRCEAPRLDISRKRNMLIIIIKYETPLPTIHGSPCMLDLRKLRCGGVTELSVSTLPSRG